MDPLETLPAELEKFWRTDDGMTACERAEAYGIDLSLLKDNLRLEVSGRLARHESAAALARSFAKGAHDAGA